MATYGYLRASTKKQVDSPETQRTTIGQYAAMAKLVDADDIEFFADPGVSGKVQLHKRKGGAALLAKLQPGDVVIIAKLDRMFRNLRDCLETFERFKSQGVKVCVCNFYGGSINFETPIGKLIITILAAVAEFERDLISERITDGLRERRRRGVRASNHAGYGFMWKSQRQPDGRMAKVAVPDPEERDVMRQIAAWRLRNPAFTWEEIEAAIRKAGITTRKGKPWDQNRIRRAHTAELELRAAEAKGTGAHAGRSD